MHILPARIMTAHAECISVACGPHLLVNQILSLHAATLLILEDPAAQIFIVTGLAATMTPIRIEILSLQREADSVPAASNAAGGQQCQSRPLGT